ncbi:MAG: hypothetical protein MUE79_02630 [Nitratireductor sp.]|nr:hypothetical protein [Nitratireductor sp.]
MAIACMAEASPPLFHRHSTAEGWSPPIALEAGADEYRSIELTKNKSGKIQPARLDEFWGQGMYTEVKSVSIVAGFIVFFLTISAKPAHAYIDPVSTSIALQVLAGGVAAAFVAFRRFRDRVIGLFRRGPDKDSAPGTGDGE